MAECDIHTSKKDADEGQIVLVNPIYGSLQHPNGVSSHDQSAEPYHSYVDFSIPESSDYSSTLRIVSNPIYGTQSPLPTTNARAYSAPKPVTPDYTSVTFKGNENSKHEVANTSGPVLVEIADTSP